MSMLTMFFPPVGAPTRTRRYTSGSGTHDFLAGAKWCRVTVVAGGGNGGANSTWASVNDRFYEAGGGGGAGETRIVEFDPTYLGGSTSYAVGAAGSDSRFHNVTAEKGANGLQGIYETTGSYRFDGGIGGGWQRFGNNDADTEKPKAPKNSFSHPGDSGGKETADGGAGGNSTHGTGGAGGAAVTGTSAPLAATNAGASGTGFGAGGGGAGAGASHLIAEGTRALASGGAGTGGLIVVEEWVY